MRAGGEGVCERACTCICYAIPSFACEVTQSMGERVCVREHLLPLSPLRMTLTPQNLSVEKQMGQSVGSRPESNV